MLTRLLFAASVLILTTGCAKTVQNRVTVLDAETGEPIVGAKVSVSYPWAMFAPTDEGTTNPNGIVELRATRDRARKLFPNWTVEHPLYFPHSDGLESRDAAFEIERAITEGATSSPINLTLRRWARPEPTVVVRVPTGYRGYVRITPSPSSPLTTNGHPRRFECTAEPDGHCECPRQPILYGLPPFNTPTPPATYEFLWDDGTPLENANTVPGAESGEVKAWDFGPVGEGSRVFLIADEPAAASERRMRYPSGVNDRKAEREFIERVEHGPLHSP